MRRLVTFVVVALVTATVALHWLHDGDLRGAVEPLVAEWDADLLARNAGIDGADALEDEAPTP